MNIPDEAILAQKAIVETFGDLLVAVYLYGSAVAGGLQKDSDVDLFAIVSGEPASVALATLTERLLGLSGRIGSSARCMEVTVVCREDIVPWRYPPRKLYQYGEWLREGFERNAVPEATLDPDLAVILSQVRQNGVALFGSPAVEAIDPVPSLDLRAAMRDCLPELLDNLRGDERNVLLTLSRIWATAVTGEFMAKDVAARWAALRLPPEQSGAMLKCAEAYLGSGFEIGETEAENLAALLQQEIERVL